MREKESLLSKVIVLKRGQVEQALERRDALVVSRAKDRIHMGNKSGRICTTVFRHALFDRLEVFPGDCRRLGLGYGMRWPIGRTRNHHRLGLARLMPTRQRKARDTVLECRQRGVLWNIECLSRVKDCSALGGTHG